MTEIIYRRQAIGARRLTAGLEDSDSGICPAAVLRSWKYE